MEQIKQLLQSRNYDVRISKSARFMDQKVTPDVLSINADCILQFIGAEQSKEFSSKDIWTSEYASKNVPEIFNKTDLSNEEAKSEYDKFFAQPLKTLAYVGILAERKEHNRNLYSVKELQILEYIALKERNALMFLNEYLYKVLSDSGVWNIFETFFEKQNSDSFYQLKNGFKEFLYNNTKITRDNTKEPSRIFTKVLNPLAYSRNLKGTIRGHISEDAIGYDELMYNRKNWRDIEKKKNITRKEYTKIQEYKNSEKARVNYSVAKAKRFIKEKYYPNSEVQDEFSNGEATQVHHIFPENEYPDIRAHLENLILLTPTQHFTLAHSNNNTRYINKDYQKICLLAKSDSVEISLRINDEFYTIESFIEVLNIGIEPKDKFVEKNTIQEIKTKIVEEFETN